MRSIHEGSGNAGNVRGRGLLRSTNPALFRCASPELKDRGVPKTNWGEVSGGIWGPMTGGGRQRSSWGWIWVGGRPLNVKVLRLVWDSLRESTARACLFEDMKLGYGEFLLFSSSDRRREIAMKT